MRLKRITDYLKSKHQLHSLRGEVIATKRTIPNSREFIHFIPELFIPELKIPIEFTSDKERDEDYMAIGLLPMVISDSLTVEVEVYIDEFLEFHKKWRAGHI
tara:strand:+ start:753 stop:1058 length:306 start_codon:yes stop_codon:yes gene_type:complete